MNLTKAIVALAVAASVCFPTHAQKKKNMGQNEQAVVEAVKTIHPTGTLTTSPAAVMVVNSTADAADAVPGNGVCATAGGACTLRAAVEEANALAGADTITFASPLFDTAQTITLSGQVSISSEITINGPGADKLSLSGGNLNRVLYVSLTTATIRDLALANGRLVNEYGGALHAQQSNVTIQRVHVKDNQAQFGGGIFATAGTMTVNGSTFSGNIAEIGGGAIYNNSDMTVVGSTFSGNTADGGGAFVSDSNLSISDSTITNNTAVDMEAGGIYDASFSLTIRNSIIAGNFSPVSNDPDVFLLGGLNSQGYNLIGVGGGFFTSPGDQEGTAAAPLDAKLGPLGNNGGPTPTHSLLAGSPAIDAGDSGELTDQRGMARLVDQPGFTNISIGADIGAYELQASTAAPVRVTGQVTDRYGRGVYGAAVLFTDGSGAVKHARTNMFGYYTVSDLPAGDSYVVTVQAKRMVFDTQLFSATAAFDGLDFRAR